MLPRPLRAHAASPPGAPHDRRRLQVVLFSGGRGSRALAQPLVGRERVDVTLVINGYDDGASTGEVRRFLGDSLGPSDFRKNASRVAAELKTTFASHYAREISLAEALHPNAIAIYNQRATGEKFLINPNK